MDIHYLSNGTLIHSIPIGKNILEETFAEYSKPEMFYNVNTVLSQITYKFDVSKLDEKPKKVREIKYSGFDDSKYDVDDLEYISKDNKTSVPIFIIKKKHQKGLKPCLLYGYGRFCIYQSISLLLNFFNYCLGGFGDIKKLELNPLFVYFLNEFDGIIGTILRIL